MATLDLVELGLTWGVAVGAEVLVPPRRSCHPSLLTGPRGAMRLQSAPGVRVQPGQDGGPRDARCRIAPAPARIGTFTEPKVLQRRAPLRTSAATGMHTATELACRAPRADPGSRPDVGRQASPKSGLVTAAFPWQRLRRWTGQEGFAVHHWGLLPSAPSTADRGVKGYLADVRAFRVACDDDLAGTSAGFGVSRDTRSACAR